MRQLSAMAAAAAMSMIGPMVVVNPCGNDAPEDDHETRMRRRAEALAAEQPVEKTVTAADLARMERAQQKRARKAAKLARSA